MNEIVINIAVKDSLRYGSTENKNVPDLKCIYEKHYQSLYQNVLLITKCSQTTEDIVHDVFINFWVKKDKLGEINDLHSYLIWMSRNHAISYLRRKKIEKQVLEEFHLQSKETFDARSNKTDILQICGEAVAQLPSRQRLVYELRREYGWKREKIAAELNISPFTVKATMQNALKALKKYTISKYQ